MSTSWVTAARQVPGLDHDPCPGDAPGVRRLATDLRARSDGLHEAVTACRGWEPAGWTGPASDAARSALTGLGEHMGTLGRSFEVAAEALDAWASELGRLQDEASALGELALDNRRHRLAATVRVVAFGGPPGSEVLGDVEDLRRLERERADIQHRAEELHRRWQADGRRAGATLDGAAPPDRAGWWRGTWDLAHDGYRLGVRQQARALVWCAGVLDVTSTVSGVAAVLLPPTAPVTVPLAMGSGLAAAGVHAHLAIGADGSPGPAVTGALTLGAGSAFRVLSGAAAGASTAVARVTPALDDAVDGALTGSDVADVVGAIVQRPDEVARHGSVSDQGGVEVPVVVHDVAEPWQIGHGWLGAGFAGVATVPVPTPTATGPVVPSPPDVRTPLPHHHVRAPHRAPASPEADARTGSGPTRAPGLGTRRAPSPTAGG